MNWELFYLVCFVVGFAFSVLSFVGGFTRFHVHVPKHLHLGGGGHAGGHVGGHVPTHGTAHAGHQAPTHAAKSGTKSGGHFPFVNPTTMAAFLTWFGGTGYLLVHLRHIWVFAGLLLATLAGLAAASIVFVFVAKVLMANERDLDPMDYEMVGVLGCISSAVRAGGTGEMIFTQEGVRKPCAARSEDGGPLARGEEVVVTRYERGIAYVRQWEDFTNPTADAVEGKTIHS
jgi:membrane protein implicated in regulation of membrane protease activity